MLEDQLQGKYKGIVFGVRKETLIEVGQKRVKHLYPKTDAAYGEAMGESPFVCSVELFFHGENYKDKFRAFEKAISDPSPGKLFLPTFGLRNNIVAEPANFESSQKSLGEIPSTVIFYETIDRPSPIDTNITEQDVADEAQIARLSLKDTFENNYVIPATANNLLTAKGDILALGNDIKKITNKAREVEFFLKKTNSVLIKPTEYANLLLSTTDPIGFLQNLSLSFTGSKGVSVFRKMSITGNSLSNSMSDIKSGIIPVPSTFSSRNVRKTEINTSVPYWENNTSEEIDRNLGRSSIADTFRVTGLIALMESYTTKDYTTTEEITADQQEFSELYESIIENNETSKIIADMKPLLDSLRNSSDSVLEKKRQQSFTIIEVDIIRPMSCWLLAYELYGEYLQTTAQHDYMSNLIAGLNRSQVENRLVGTVKVVEIGN